MTVNFTARIGSKKSPTHSSIQVEQRGKLLLVGKCGFTSRLLYIERHIYHYRAFWLSRQQLLDTHYNIAIIDYVILFYCYLCVR